MFVIGIDPGQKGGIAIYQDFRGRTVEYRKVIGFEMPIVNKEVAIRSLHKMIVDEMKNYYAKTHQIPEPFILIEKAQAMPKQGTASMFSYGKGFGKLLGMCETAKWSYQLVTPQAWKKKVLAGTKKDKGAAILYTENKYPEVDLMPGKKRKPCDGIADAICIMEYGCLIWRNK